MAEINFKLLLPPRRQAVINEHASVRDFAISDKPDLHQNKFTENREFCSKQ
jgi:hypothetical protein